MAAGQGFKTFATGDVLTAGDVNGYLMSQTVMVFADSTARSAAITSPQEGMITYLKDTNATEYYSGSAWVGISNSGDITSVTAGTGLSGGGTSGDVTLTNSMATTIDAKGDLIVGTANDTFARLAVGGNGSALVSDSTTGSGLAYSNANTRGNPVINSAMDIWQRGTSVSASGSQFGPDRWNSYRGAYAAGITVSRQVTGDTTNLPDIQYCARVQRDSGNTSTAILQFDNNFETINSIPYSGKTVTISFYARAGANYSASSSVLTANLYSGTGTDQALRNGLTGQTQVTTLNASLTTTWQRFTFSGTIGTTATQLVVAFSYAPTGTAGAADYFEITGVQLDLSATAITFRRSSTTIQGELAACQRYYYRNIANGAFTLMTNLGSAESATSARFTVQHPVTMRTAPNAVEYSTLIVYSPSGGTNSTVSSFTTLYGGAQVSLMTAGVTGLTANASYYLYTNNSTSGYIAFSAEL